MIKQNKLKMLISSIIILLPVITVAAFHKSIEENALFFAMSLSSGITLVIHWLCIIITAIDNKKREQSPKVLGLLFWICPMISVMTSIISVVIILGIDFKMSYILGPILAFTMILFGNYLPKCKQNFFIGLRFPWTLANEENWNKTHRFAGKLWVLGGALLAILAFLPDMVFIFVMIGIVITISVIPAVYSYRYYKAQMKNGNYEKTEELSMIKQTNKKYWIITLVMLAGLAVFLVAICFTGEIEIEYGNDDFTVTSTYYSDLVIDYSDIENIELRDSVPPGSKVIGFNSPKILLGSFKNEEFGNYSRYTYTKCDTCIVLTVDGKTVIINGESDDATRQIYENLSKVTEG